MSCYETWIDYGIGMHRFNTSFESGISPEN